MWAHPTYTEAKGLCVTSRHLTSRHTRFWHTHVHQLITDGFKKISQNWVIFPWWQELCPLTWLFNSNNINRVHENWSARCRQSNTKLSAHETVKHKVIRSWWQLNTLGGIRDEIARVYRHATTTWKVYWSPGLMLRFLPLIVCYLLWGYLVSVKKSINSINMESFLDHLVEKKTRRLKSLVGQIYEENNW